MHIRKATGYVIAGGRHYVHRLVAQRALGQELPKGAIVHHVDGDPSNNDPSNLVILQNQREHKELHRRERVRDAGGDPWTDRICGGCGRIYSDTEKTKTSTYCKPCRARVARLARRRVKLSIS